MKQETCAEDRWSW